MNSAIKYLKNNKDSYIKDLGEYVSIPSISTESKHKGDIKKAAEWISMRMKKAGLENIRLLSTKGNPVVYGDWLHKKDQPTVLFYGHYDVQPPDPLDQWESDPFKLRVKGQEMFGRGVADNKAPHLSHVLGIEALLKITKELPVNVKFLIEGEEEIGSVNMTNTLKRYKNLFQSDIAFVSDGIMYFDAPVVEYGLRGLVYFEVNVKCLNKDMHSGLYGGVVDNAANVLSYIISKLKDRNGKILIPGVYNNVRTISKDEHKLLGKAETESQEILESTGAKKVFGEKGYLNIERTGARPTLDVNGFKSGFIGEGMKTIIPAEATAKISMRLVPDQNFKDIEKLFRSFVKRIVPDTCNVRVTLLNGSNPTLFNWETSDFKIAQKSLEEVFGAKAKYKLVGGSVAAVGDIQEILGIDSIFTGFSLPDCGMHSPNEKFRVDNFLKGMEVTIKYLQRLGKQKIINNKQ